MYKWCVASSSTMQAHDNVRYERLAKSAKPMREYLVKGKTCNHLVQLYISCAVNEEHVIFQKLPATFNPLLCDAEFVVVSAVSGTDICLGPDNCRLCT